MKEIRKNKSRDKVGPAWVAWVELETVAQVNFHSPSQRSQPLIRSIITCDVKFFIEPILNCKWTEEMNRRCRSPAGTLRRAPPSYQILSKPSLSEGPKKSSLMLERRARFWSNVLMSNHTKTFIQMQGCCCGISQKTRNVCHASTPIDVFPISGTLTRSVLFATTRGCLISSVSLISALVTQMPKNH